MKFPWLCHLPLFLFSVGLARAQEAAPQEKEATAIAYELELVAAELPQVRIWLEFAGDGLGSPARIGLAGGMELPERGRDLKLQSASVDGKTLAWERAGDAEWQLLGALDGNVRLCFVLETTAYRASAIAPTYYLPILEPKLMHLIGSNVLPVPLTWDRNCKRPIRLQWRGFREQGWHTCASFAPNGATAERELSIDDFCHALFLAGDFQVEERIVQGEVLHVAIWGTDWATPPSAFADLCALIVEMERSFFEDYDHPRYLISLIPVGEKNPQTIRMGGTGLTDSFALFLPPGAPLDNASDLGLNIPWLLAHEMFHEWNGHAIRLAQPERLGYWFSEGFTDFYTRRLLFANDLLSEEQYIASWNRRFEEYQNNPERLAPATRIEEAFWTVPEIGFLPYQRGDLVALLVDRAIARKSQGERSLDDLMRELVVRARAGKGAFSVEELLAVIAAFSDEATAASVRSIVIDGADVILPEDFDLPGKRVVRGKAAYTIQ